MSTVKRECRVVMLPTEKASDIILRMKDDIMHHRRHYGRAWEDMGDVYQHLYILSDDEIKEGDWFIVELFKISGESDGFHIEQCTKTDAIWINNYDVIKTRHRENCKKIIATTDSSLTKEMYCVSSGKYQEPLPQPSEAFILKYIDAYNSGKPIEKAMVEYDQKCSKSPCEMFSCDANPTGCNHPICTHKVNPKDNTITISDVKDSWTKEEVGNLLNQMRLDLDKSGAISNEEFIRWIEEKL